MTKDEFYIGLGKKIKVLRNKLGLTQMELSGKARVSNRTISTLENPNTKYKMSDKGIEENTLIRLALVLDKENVDQWLRGAGYEPYQEKIHREERRMRSTFLYEPHEPLIEGYLSLVKQKYLQADENKKAEIRKGLESLCN